MTKLGSYIYIFFLFIFIISCTDDHINEAKYSELILSDDGGWGYTGHHALINNDQLFYSYLDTHGNTWVASYDIETGEISRNNIWTADANLHSSNPLLIRPDGRIQVFLDMGAYVDKRVRWKVSKHPGDISEFGELQKSTLEADITQGRQFYPVLHKPSGNVYLVINAIHENNDRTAVMWKSSDGGDNFDEFYELWALGRNLLGNRAYTRIFAEQNGIHFVTVSVGWNEPIGDHDIGRVEGIYYTRYDVNKEAFFHSNGTRSFGLDDLPVYDAYNFDTVWHWETDGNGTKRALWSDIVADELGRPYIAFSVQESVPEGVSTLHEGHWATPNEDGGWINSKVATLARGWDNTPERKNYGIAIDPQDPTTVFVSKSTSIDEDLSQVHKMKTSDSGVTWQVVEVLSEESRITTLVVPRLSDTSNRNIDVLWLEGVIEGWGQYDTKIKTAISDHP